MSPTFTRSRSDDWRAACFVDGKRLSGSYWNPDFREHRIDSVPLQRGGELMKCKMRFGSVDEKSHASANSIDRSDAEVIASEKHRGRIDIILSRGIWIPISCPSISDKPETPIPIIDQAAGEENSHRSVYATDPVKMGQSPTRPMMFAERGDEQTFYSFHFILETRENLISYGLIPDHIPAPPPNPSFPLPDLSSRKKRRRDADDVDSEEEGDILHQLDILKARLKRSEDMNKELIKQRGELRRELEQTKYTMNILKALRDGDDTRTIV
ncbi:uncharacterized protein I303_102910 [Kwoniella dejecticola CBS 10117]|uniref:DUF7918 domain-containing protein n=1 Tax=Kwoniella dejecticola CBS 10117 TaxID=1296121 RepID=A0A1A6AA23_9TREE|nr:uncharacterized protein I303_02930 [Kwoniella dejecticola CBS 10117]OBR86909.1 hypothetical protein I303_02930 [Kwoniella dejecticola CBS 10117]